MNTPETFDESVATEAQTIPERTRTLTFEQWSRVVTTFRASCSDCNQIWREESQSRVQEEARAHDCRTQKHSVISPAAAELLEKKPQ